MRQTGLLRSMESDLINLVDAANSTHNMLSEQEAGFQAAGIPARVVGSLKAAIAAKASPTSALSIGERPGLFSPLRQFNGNMRDAFSGVAPRAAELDIGIPQPAPAPQQPPAIGSIISAVAQSRKQRENRVARSAEPPKHRKDERSPDHRPAGAGRRESATAARQAAPVGQGKKNKQGSDPTALLQDALAISLHSASAIGNRAEIVVEDSLESNQPSWLRRPYLSALYRKNRPKPKEQTNGRRPECAYLDVRWCKAIAATFVNKGDGL